MCARVPEMLCLTTSGGGEVSEVLVGRGRLSGLEKDEVWVEGSWWWWWCVCVMVD